MARPRRVVPVVLWILLSACGGGPDVSRRNTPPVADAGPSQLTPRNVTVVLDGSASRDADGDPLTFRWSMVSSPFGSAAALAGGGTSPTFTPDLVGTYAVGLVVSDGKADSAMATVAVEVLGGTSYLPDTGVTACFSTSAEILCPAPGAAFFGQDATYTSNRMRFVDDGTTVADALTGLTWQKFDPTGPFNWYEATGTGDGTYNPTAKDVCGGLTLGGHSDWRLPSRRELVGIFDYTQGWPAPSAFTGGATYWTSTHLGPSDSNVWLVEGGGQVRAALGYQDGLAAPYSVKCVRGAAWGPNAFADLGNGTVVDSMSGLQWEKADDGVARTWAAALEHCESLSLAGFTDWRLPDVKELESLVVLQPGGFTTPIDSARFSLQTDGGGLSFYWSSTTMPGRPGTALGVQFWNGAVEDGGFGKTSYKFARCVR